MKKGILVLIIAALLFPVWTLAQELLEQTQIQAIPSPLNVVLTRPADETQWLLKLKSCPTLQAGQRIGLGVRGALNSYQDYLDLGLSRRCEIAKAFPFNEMLIVKSTNRDRAAVTDENGKNYDLFHDGRCGDLLNWVNQPIYADRAGPTLAKGDRLIVPGEPKVCSITVLEKIEPEGIQVPETETGDIARPADVTRVRAIPKNGKALVYWRRTADNVGVDHYIVSTERYRIDRKRLDTAENQKTTENTYLIVESLENDTDYYFYVKAVDAAGNMSSFWSEPGHARVKSSAPPDAVKLKGQRQLKLQLTKETDDYFLFQWVMPPTTTRFLVSLTLDRKPDSSLKNTLVTEFKVKKAASRKGKKLRLTVSAFNTRGFVEQEKIDFSF